MSMRLPLDQIREVLLSDAALPAKAERIADHIRRSGGYRWVGIYEVSGGEIAILGWSGTGVPAHPRFPVTQGLCGAAVASRSTVIVADVTADPRYLTTFGSTRSEMIVPVFGAAGLGVVGVIDVESERLNAFTDEDRDFGERCASAIAGLW